VPNIKLSTNSSLYKKICKDIDINNRTIAKGKEKAGEVSQKKIRSFENTASEGKSKIEMNIYRASDLILVKKTL
tara:strand:+ start:225 stop:446 length:222 start_codon:yes stop_codon:yes gene_type:complete